MEFILIEDITSKIKSSILSDTLQKSNVISTNDPQLELVEADAKQLVISYISNKYDTNSIFSQRNEKRSRMIVNIMCDIMIYELLTRLSSNILPEVRETKYERALTMLSQIRDGILTIDLPEKNINHDYSNILLWGSDKSNHYDW